jgi:hypothetical protein
MRPVEELDGFLMLEKIVSLVANPKSIGADQAFFIGCR